MATFRPAGATGAVLDSPVMPLTVSDIEPTGLFVSESAI
jgi:hypothetical protein